MQTFSNPFLHILSICFQFFFINQKHTSLFSTSYYIYKTILYKCETCNKNEVDIKNQFESSTDLG